MFISSKFSFMITVLLTRSPLMPITSASFSSAAVTMAVTGCFMPMFTTEYPLLLKMMSTKFLPMS